MIMGEITFLHLGKNKCPRCGSVGDKRDDENIRFYECPRCHTEFTSDIIINDGELDEEIFENT
jgi:DNA-directed RNA polymerase subunit RPC12/RpoP